MPLKVQMSHDLTEDELKDIIKWVGENKPELLPGYKKRPKCCGGHEYYYADCGPMTFGVAEHNKYMKEEKKKSKAEKYREAHAKRDREKKEFSKRCFRCGKMKR